MKKSYTLISPCFFGMEKMLAREIKDLGFEIIKTEDGRITYKTGEDGIAKANMWLRCAERVHLKVAEFEAKTFDELLAMGIKIDVRKVWSTISSFKSIIYKIKTIFYNRYTGYSKKSYSR